MQTLPAIQVKLNKYQTIGSFRLNKAKHTQNKLTHSHFSVHTRAYTHTPLVVFAQNSFNPKILEKISAARLSFQKSDSHLGLFSEFFFSIKQSKKYRVKQHLGENITTMHLTATRLATETAES